MFLADPGVVQGVVLVVVFDDRAGQGGAFLDPQTLGHRPGGDVAHHHFQRDDLHFLDKLFAHVQAAHEMGGHADARKLGHQIFADAVVQNTLAFDRVFLGAIAGGGVVLEILDDGAGLGAFVQDLGLAFINDAAAFHGMFLFARGSLAGKGGRPEPGPMAPNFMSEFTGQAWCAAMLPKRWSTSISVPYPSWRPGPQGGAAIFENVFI